MFRTISIVLALFLLACMASAGTYYADISVDLDASGSAYLTSVSNHPSLQPDTRTDAFTSKKGATWLFNLTLPKEDIFSDYVYAVDLPLGASVNYVKADAFRITNQDGRIHISGTDTNDSMSIVIQYQLDGIQTADYSVYFLSAAVLGLIGILAFMVSRRKRSMIVDEPPTVPTDAAPKKKPDLPENYSRYEGVLTDRQKDIFNIISRSEKPVNQSHLCDSLQLPKSSVSRNVSTLVDLGLVDKTRIGMSTFLSLKKE